jgi:signal transduction histidine kinase/DNA-binding response OmpR family regulator
MAANILIVDDEMAIRKLLTRYLDSAGHKCHAVDSAESAKEILDQRRFDLLLSDLKLPGESGLDLVRYARDHFPEMGRIMITGVGSPEISNEILQVGVYGYIIKPVTRNEVLITVENSLRHLRLDRHMQACKVELEQKVSGQMEKLAAIMNNLSVGVAMFDIKLSIIELNRRLQQWFPDSAPGKKIPCSHIGKCPQNGTYCDDCPMTETFRAGEPVEAVRSIAAVQGEREFRIVASPIFDHSGHIYAGIALYEDITEKMLLERDLRQAQKLEAVGQLAAGIAHEINTPIQYVGDNISFLKESLADITRVIDTYDQFWRELVEKGVVPDEMGRQMAKIISDADLEYLWEELPKTIDQSLDGVHRVEKIVRAMKDFSHPGDKEKTPIDINKLLQTTITVCRNEWKYVAEMETDLTADLPLVQGFAADISQVFLNIIVNGAHAIGEFTESGKKGLGKITIRTSRAGDGVLIQIEDSGGGIPEKIQDRIFEPFFTTKVRGKGTGQGLAISKRIIVDGHHGTLSFETNKGSGTAFIIELPAA